MVIFIRADVHAVPFVSWVVLMCLIARIQSWIACYLVGKIITPAPFGQYSEELVSSSILVFKTGQGLHNWSEWDNIKVNSLISSKFETWHKIRLYFFPAKRSGWCAHRNLHVGVFLKLHSVIRDNIICSMSNVETVATEPSESFTCWCCGFKFFVWKTLSTWVKKIWRLRRGGVVDMQTTFCQSIVD